MGQISFQMIFMDHNGYLLDQNWVSLVVKFKQIGDNIRQQLLQVSITQMIWVSGCKKINLRTVTLIMRYCVSNNQAHVLIQNILPNNLFYVLSICVFWDILKIKPEKTLSRKYYNKCLVKMDHQQRCKMHLLIL